MAAIYISSETVNSVDGYHQRAEVPYGLTQQNTVNVVLMQTSYTFNADHKATDLNILAQMAYNQAIPWSFGENKTKLLMPSPVTLTISGLESATDFQDIVFTLGGGVALVSMFCIQRSVATTINNGDTVLIPILNGEIHNFSAV